MSATLAHVTALFQLRAFYDRSPSTWSPASSDAHRLAALGLIMTVVGGVIFLFVVGVVLVGLWRRRSGDLDANPDPSASRAPAVSENWWVLGGGLAMPVVVLTGVFVLTLSTLHAYEVPPEHAPVIVLIGHQWWWEVRYPHDTVVTANEIHIPVGQAMRVELRSDDVIHSFWAPNLEGKIDLVPGQQNEMVLRADTAGVYRAECAEYCGPQHAHMALSVVAEPAASFARWLAEARAPARPVQNDAESAGLAAFMSHSCSSCHTIRGTPAAGVFGPDLTHVGSRLTIAGGMLPNTAGNLGGWILEPDRLKPGTLMPPNPMNGASLQALVQYLEGLK